MELALTRYSTWINLHEMGDLLHQLKKGVLDLKDRKLLGDTLIRGLWKVNCFFQPSQKERIFRYVFLVAQTTDQGCAYCTADTYSDDLLNSLVGKDYLDLTIEDRCLDIALLDSVYASLPSTAQDEITLHGNSVEKAVKRAQVIVDEADRLARHRGLSGAPQVVNVGAVGHVVDELLKRGYSVTASDMEPRLVGSEICGCVTVSPGEETSNLVSRADIAIVTGMTLATNTLDAIIGIAAGSNTAIIIFAETGSGFASTYLGAGVNCVVSEPFPFYIFQGATLLRIYRQYQPGQGGRT